MQKSTVWIVSLLGVVGTGCVSGSKAPFHMYDSPMLQSQFHPAMGQNRSFDPLKMGGEPQVDRHVMVAESKASPKPVAQETLAQAPKTSAKGPTKTPTLSVRTGSKPDNLTTGSHPVTAKGAHSPHHSSGYVAAVLIQNEIEVTESAAKNPADLYKMCKSKGSVQHDSARPGDLVFFHNVVDVNRDGRNNDWYSHVAVVEGVTNGVYTVQGYAFGSLQKHQLRLAKDEPTDASSRLREPSAQDPPFTQYYTSELFAGFCSILGDRPNLTMIDEWKPAQ